MLYRSRQTNATATLSWFMHSCVPPCWIDDIWHRFHMLKLFPFDACTNTGGETTDSKCFDAISQQSVKQKTFVAFYTARENSVNSKGRRDQSTEAVSLLMPLHLLCLGQAERGSNTHTKWVKDRGGMTEILVGAKLPCVQWLVNRVIIQKRVHGFLRKPLKCFVEYTRKVKQ